MPATKQKNTNTMNAHRDYTLEMNTGSLEMKLSDLASSALSSRSLAMIPDVAAPDASQARLDQI